MYRVFVWHSLLFMCDIHIQASLRHINYQRIRPFAQFNTIYLRYRCTLCIVCSSFCLLYWHRAFDLLETTMPMTPHSSHPFETHHQNCMNANSISFCFLHSNWIATSTVHRRAMLESKLPFKFCPNFKTNSQVFALHLHFHFGDFFLKKWAIKGALTKQSNPITF